MSATDFLEKFKDWIQHATLITWLGNSISWAITKGLYWLSSQSEKLVDEAFRVFDFLNYGQVKTIYQGFQLVSGTVLAIMIAVLGFKMIMNQKIKLKNSVIRVIIMATLVVQMPALINKGVAFNKTMFQDSKSLVLNTSNQLQSTGTTSLSFNIVKQNVADLNFVAYQGFDTLLDPESAKNQLTQKNFGVVDLSTILEPSAAEELAKKSKNKDANHLGTYLANSEDGKKVEAVDIDSGWFDFFKEGTFRYRGNHAAMNIGFLVLTIFNVLLFGKLILLLIDLVFGKIYFPLAAFSDLETGQRSKKLIEGIVSNLFAIGFLGISASLFVVFYSFLVSLNLSILAFAFTAIIGAFAFIKGSDTLAKTFGINTSIKEGALGLAVMYGAAKLAQAGAKSAKKTGKDMKEYAKKLPEKAQKSIQKTEERANSLAESLGTEFGHIDERGFGGAMKDKAKGMASTMSQGVEKAGNKVAEPLNKVTESFNQGVADGISKGVSERSAETKPPLPDTLSEPTRRTTLNEDVPHKTSLASLEPANDVDKTPHSTIGVTTAIPKEPDAHAEGFDTRVAQVKKAEAIQTAIAPSEQAPVESPLDTYTRDLEHSISTQARPAPGTVEPVGNSANSTVPPGQVPTQPETIQTLDSSSTSPKPLPETPSGRTLEKMASTPSPTQAELSSIDQSEPPVSSLEGSYQSDAPRNSQGERPQPPSSSPTQSVNQPPSPRPHSTKPPGKPSTPKQPGSPTVNKKNNGSTYEKTDYTGKFD